MENRTCSLCPRPHYGHGYCSAHWKRWYATGDPRPDVPIGHRAITTEGSLYRARHDRVYRERGKARDYACGHCGNPATTWAQKHETTGDSPDEYMPLCWPCHAAYDDFIGRIRHLRKGLSPEGAEKVRQLRQGEWASRSREERAEIMARVRAAKRKGGRQGGQQDLFDGG